MKYYHLIFIFLGLVSLSFQLQCANYATGFGKCTCLNGYFSSDPQSIPCQQCPTGTTTQLGNNQYGDVSVCNRCTDNYYQTAQATQGQPATCIACPTGTKFINEGRLRFLSFTAQNESICSECQVGYYLKQSSQLGKAATCAQCPSNSAFVSGSLNGQSEASCNGCMLGYYVAKIAKNGQPATCSPCPNQAFADYATYLQTIDDCNKCFTGYYSTAPSKSQANCKQCPENTTTPTNIPIDSNGISQCMVCKINSYMTQPADIQKPATCQSCPAGSGNYVMNTQVGDVSFCNICIEGYYMTQLAVKGNQPTAASCSQCPPNSTSKSTSIVNSISSCICYDSQSIPLSSKQQTCQCKPGYGGNVASTLNSPTGCSPCGPGYYSNNLGQCELCPAGKYSNGPSNASCLQCQPGEYASGTGNQSCKTCPNGQSSNQDFSDCNCPSGQGKVVNSNSQQICVNCVAGQYTNSSGYCADCPAGHYSNDPSNTSCKQCLPGQYAFGTGNTHCLSCPSGSINNDDFSGCKCYDSNSVPWQNNQKACICAQNYYGDASKSTNSQNNCQQCPKIPGAAQTQNNCKLQISPSTPGYGAYSYGNKKIYSTQLFLLVILTFLIFLD